MHACRPPSDVGEFAVWDIDIQGSMFTDVSRSPCGANLKLYSPAFELPATASASGERRQLWWVPFVRGAIPFTNFDRLL